MIKKITTLIITLLPSIIYSSSSIETALSHQMNEQFDDAISIYKKITNNEPYNMNAYFNLGYCYLSLGQGEKAIAAFDNVLKINPYALPALYNKAFTYKTIGNIDQAIELYNDIIQNNPDYEPAHLALGLAYITQGNFEKGWKQHERHLIKIGRNGDKLRQLIKDNDLSHKKILLRPEGDFGDTLLFVRYAKRLQEMGAHVIVACQKQLIPLLSHCTYINRLISCNDITPYYDADATMMSLPALFADTDITVPKEIPYLSADPSLIDYWKHKLSSDTNFKVGICWQASVKNDTSRLLIARRGCPLEYFTRLHDIDGISFYSLQKYDGIEQLTTLPSTFPLHVFNNLDEQSGAFMDTAAIIKNLDLIITVDTSIVHLAGGLGAKVWLLHPYATADWRWICHRNDSYWYPNLRIFKQEEPFNWDNVMSQVHIALKNLLIIKGF